MYASSSLGFEAKTSVPAALSTASVVVAIILICFFRTRYSSSPRRPISQPSVTAPSPSQEPDRSGDSDDPSSSLRETKLPNLRFNPTTIVRLTHKDDEPSLDLRVVICRYQAIFDSITKGNQTIVNSLRELPYRFPVDVFLPENIPWSSQNLGSLTKQLDSVWKALGDDQRCSNLTIQLPSVRLAEVTNGTGILAVTTEVLLPPNLETLTWTGNREQLPMFLQDQPGFSTLTNLTIHSALSMDDCRTLLYWGSEILQSVAFWTIRSHNLWDVRVALPLAFNSVQSIQMTALRSLTIASAVDIRPLYSPQPLIRFPVLETVTLKISGPGFNIWDCRRWLTIGGMQYVPNWHVHCRMSEEDESRMRQHYHAAVLKLTEPTPDNLVPSPGNVTQSNRSPYRRRHEE